MEALDELNIWLDDIREAPDESFVTCHSVNEAKRVIEQAEELGEQAIGLIDMDHDLGDYAYDGGDGICLMDWLVERGTLYNIAFHTANPVGRANMQRMKDRFW